MEALDSARRRLVGASVGGLLAATVLPAGLLAVVDAGKTTGAPQERSRLALPLENLALKDLAVKDLAVPANLVSRAQRKRVLRANPHYAVYKQAKRRYGVSWFLVAALHHEHKTLSRTAVLAAARRLRGAGAGSALDRRAWNAVAATHRGRRSAATATRVLRRARTWKRLGVIPQLSEKPAKPVDGVIPQCGYFHCPRPGHLHNGVDLSAPTGTPIHAVEAGRVAVLERTGESSGYGNFVCVQHNPELASCYAHLSSFAPGLELGDEVGRGQLVGLVGCTGTCYGPHLHFEIRRGPADCSECAVDPVAYLSGEVPELPESERLALARRREHAHAAQPHASVPVTVAPAIGPAAGAPAVAPRIPAAAAPSTPTAKPPPDPGTVGATESPPAEAVPAPSARPTAPSRDAGRRAPVPADASPAATGGASPAPPSAPPPGTAAPPAAEPEAAGTG